MAENNNGEKEHNDIVVTCLNINCPERTGGKCIVGEKITKRKGNCKRCILIQLELQRVISEEMQICNQEGMPTSRLTSLQVKMDNVFINN